MSSGPTLIGPCWLHPPQGTTSGPATKVPVADARCPAFVHWQLVPKATPLSAQAAPPTQVLLLLLGCPRNLDHFPSPFSLCSSSMQKKDASLHGFQPRFQHFATQAIHVGQEPEQWNSQAVVPPISLSTTFKQGAPGKHSVSWMSSGGGPGRGKVGRNEKGMQGIYAMAYRSSRRPRKMA